MGTNVTIATIEYNQQINRIETRNIFPGDLSSRRGRIRFAGAIIRLVRVLRALEGLIKEKLDSDMVTVLR